MNTPTRILLTVALALNSAGCISAEIMGKQSSATTVQGQVLEQSSRTPIPGAIVIGTWQETKSSIAHGSTSCVHVETATTDAQGRYQLPVWKGHEPTLINSYKPGYVRSQEYYKMQAQIGPYGDLLEGFRGTAKERLEYLERMLGSTRCGSQNESEKNLHAFFSAMHEEAKNIAVTKEDLEIADALRYWASFVILDKSKPTTRDVKGRLINADQNGN